MKMKYAHLKKQTGDERFYVTLDQASQLPAVFERVPEWTQGTITREDPDTGEEKEVTGPVQVTRAKLVEVCANEKRAEERCDELNAEFEAKAEAAAKKSKGKGNGNG